jgi:hypothetical protein
LNIYNTTGPAFGRLAKQTLMSAKVQKRKKAGKTCGQSFKTTISGLFGGEAPAMNG